MSIKSDSVFRKEIPSFYVGLSSRSEKRNPDPLPGAGGLATLLLSPQDCDFPERQFLENCMSVEGDDLTFATYTKCVVYAKQQIRKGFAAVAVREGLISVDDVEKLLATNPGDHEKLPKEKEYIRLLTQGIVNDCVRRFCLQDNRSFLEGKERAIARRPKFGEEEEFHRKVEQLSILEAELVIGNPISPEEAEFNEANQIALESRLKLAKSISKAREEILGSTMERTTKQFALLALRYEGGTKVSDFRNPVIGAPADPEKDTVGSPPLEEGDSSTEE